MHKMPYTEIGRHYGKNPIGKIWGLVYRSLQLYFFVKSHQADIAVSHGSRSQLIAAALLRMPMAMFFDYEGAKGIPFFDKFIHADKYLVPEALKDEVLRPKFNDLSIFYKYPGIKEDVYLSQFTASPNALGAIALDDKKIIVTLRPPASEAHYHNPLSDQIFTALLKRLSAEESTQTVLLPRTGEQIKIALEIYKNGKGILTIPDKVVNGLDLLWASDCVVSGGGTMIREGAGLGVPAYSIFCGMKPSVDAYLESQNMLTFIQDVQAVRNIRLLKRDKSPSNIRRNNILPVMVDQIMNMV
jgi:hypothetical protein